MKRILNSLTAIVVICSLFLSLNFVYAENVPTIKIACQSNPVSFANAICNDIQKRTGEKFVFVRKSIGKGFSGEVYLLKGNNVDLCLKISNNCVNKFQHNIYYNLTREDFDPNFLKCILNPKTPHLNFPVAGYESINFYGLILKYNNGGTLKDLIESGQRLDQKQIATIIHDILTGLNCLHKENLVHGDIWPGNIMIENNEEKINAFIIDSDSTSYNIQPVNKSWRRYDGPEYILLNKGFSCKTEIFSAGIFLWELIYGKAPFGGLNFIKLEKAPLKSDNVHHLYILRYHEYLRELKNLPIYLSELSKDTNLSPGCRDLLSKLLNPDPDLRITAEEALEHSFFDILK